MTLIKAPIEESIQNKTGFHKKKSLQELTLCPKGLPCKADHSNLWNPTIRDQDAVIVPALFHVNRGHGSVEHT
jgi:hypothetical protein